MAKYGYDKSVLKGLGVGDFLNQVKVREEHINKGGTDIPSSIYNPNRIAAELHPDHLLGKIKSAEDIGGSMHYVIEPFEEAGFKKFPFYRAGQYISFEFDMGNRYTCRPYTLISSPKAALDPEGSHYEIMVGQIGPGHISAYIKDNWKPGTVVSFGAPVGNFYYDPLRDGKNVVAISAGISPFLAMAEAIADGVDDYNLTIILLSPLFNSMPERLADAAARSNGKVKVVVTYVPGMPGPPMDFSAFEPFSAELVKKYLKEDSTVYMNGVDFVHMLTAPEIEKLGIPKSRIRKDCLSQVADITKDPMFPQEAAGKTFSIKLWARGEVRELTCSSEKTIMDAIHDAGIHLTTDCRSGICGWCRSRLISGEFYMPASRDGRREADRKFGWIHPCCTYPLSDIEMEVFPVIGIK